SYWMTTAVLDPRFGLYKEEVLARLASRGIDGRPFFYPLSSLPAFADAVDGPRARRQNQASYRLGPFGLNLPSALCLTEEDVDRVCTELCEMIRLRKAA